MSKIRVTIELDADHPAVDGHLLLRLSNAAQALHRACESPAYPRVWPDGLGYYHTPEAWTERPIVTREGETIGRFIVEEARP